MVSKSPLLYMARKGKWRHSLEPTPRYQVGTSHSHNRPVTNVNPAYLPDDNPGNKVVTHPRLDE